MNVNAAGKTALHGCFLGMSMASFLILLAVVANRAAAQDTVEGQAGSRTTPVESAAAQNGVVENAVVKIYSTVRYPDYYKPWAKQAPTEVTGSGVVIKNKRILTNAHLVLYASQVQVQANQGDKEEGKAAYHSLGGKRRVAFPVCSSGFSSCSHCG
jgi:S1-C subfamily serine protease